MLTLDKLAEEMRHMHNDMCILYDMDIVRLVGVAEDERDLYYIVRNPRHRGQDGKTEYWASAVGHIVSLKGLYPEERYNYMDNVFSLNNASKTDEFKVVKEI